MLEKHVIRFLNDSVCVKNLWDTMDVICFISTKDAYYFEVLAHDLNLIFGLSVEHIKNVVEKWVKELYPLALLDGYFKLPTNIVYAPHIPIQGTPIIISVDPYELQPRQSMQSRYATTQVNPNFYGTIRIGQ